MVRIGVIREGKNPPDKRVPLTPAQCAEIMRNHSGVEVVVQSSQIRAISDEEYRSAGIEVVDNVNDCSILIGVKEVPVEMLIPEKTYLFFSHTFKKQPYNRDLLRAIVDKKIRLIDYEVLTDESGKRLIGFGRYAGIVGAYNALLAAGKKTGRYELKPAYQCEDRKEVERELAKVNLPDDFKIVLTGKGRVARGAMEILDFANVKKVGSEAFLNTDFNQPAYTQLSVRDYNKKKDGSSFENREFYEHPERFDSNFMRFASVADLYIACHYWDSNAPFIFTREDAKSAEFNLDFVADISCDIDGPVASTLRPSTIENPLYGYNAESESETDFMNPTSIGVMAVDNLPCELPKDASEDFGRELVDHVIPELLRESQSKVIERATQTDLSGKLTQAYSYLQDYLDGKE